MRKKPGKPGFFFGILSAVAAPQYRPWDYIASFAVDLQGEHMEPVKANAVSETFVQQRDGSLDVTLTDAGGQRTTLRLSASGVAGLLKVLTAISAAAPSHGPELTRIPAAFAVGTGAFDPLVLVRFENETPYGLSALDARELAAGLIEGADDIEGRNLVLH